MRIFVFKNIICLIALLPFITPNYSYSKSKKIITNTPKQMHKFGAWAVYKYKLKGQDVCYALSAPISIVPRNRTTIRSYFLVSERPKLKTLEPQFLSGGQLKVNNTVKLNIISKNKNIANFNMYVRNQFAWLQSVKKEQDLIFAMKKGAQLRVNSYIASGIKANYKFSLIGLQQALREVTLCH